MIFFKKINTLKTVYEKLQMNNNIVRMLICMLIFNSGVVNCQISVLNRSFEDQPSDATIPQGWFGCEEFTTPDILPGFWGVYNEPAEGNTYIGLITRENGSWESIGQRLSSVLEEKNCYIFSIELAHSFIYAGYDQPIKIRIWLGKSLCDKSQLIFESPYIDSEQWKTFKVKFHPDHNFEYIILEAYKGEEAGNKKGNILLDNMDLIKFCGRV